MKTNIKKTICLAGLSAGSAFLLTGCFANKENVLAVTTTVIGVQIHQKDADKTPELKVGYARTEFAFVPTDKGSTNGNGSAANSAEVLMEINAQGSMALGSVYQGGVYQRLAVGPIAVAQPGAAFMMAKDKDGTISTNTANAVSQSIIQSAASTVIQQNSDSETLAKATDDGTGKVKQEILDKLTAGTPLAGTGSLKKFYNASTDALKTKLEGSWRPFISQMMENNK
jgi:hypothetical protein